MSGRAKKRIDYAGWSVDMFSNDVKIDKLLDAHGWVGFGIYFYLCQMAFGGEGYYYEWCYDLCATTARKMGGGVGAGTVKETVGYCLQIGLFDDWLFDRWGILTSRGIQKSYLLVLKSKNRQGTEIYDEYWLLDKNSKDYQGVVFVHKNNEPLHKNVHLLGENVQRLGDNNDLLKQKESKGEYIKVNKNIMCKAEASALFEQLWQMYPCKKGKGQVSDTAKKRLYDIGLDEMTRAISRYLADLEHDKDWRKPQNGSTFFNSGYVDYLDCNYQPSNHINKKIGFNTFLQGNNDAALDEMERLLNEEVNRGGTSGKK